MTTSFLNNEEENGEGFFGLDPKGEAVTEFVTCVGSELQRAFSQRKLDRKLTQQELAVSLGVDRSRINRCLSGYSNLTLESVAELVWAMKGRPSFKIELDDLNDASCNLFTPAKEVAPVMQSNDISMRSVVPRQGVFLQQPATAGSVSSVNSVRFIK